MEYNNISPLGIEKFADRRINMTINGDLTKDRLDDLNATILQAEKMIREIADTEGSVLILLDMNTFGGKYDIECFEAMVGFVKTNSEYVNKTAVFGGPENTAIVAETVAAFGDRENIKAFSDKAEAIVWLEA